MEQALIVIFGFLGTLILVGIVGIFIMLYINKKEQSQTR